VKEVHIAATEELVPTVMVKEDMKGTAGMGEVQVEVQVVREVSVLYINQPGYDKFLDKGNVTDNPPGNGGGGGGGGGAGGGMYPIYHMSSAVMGLFICMDIIH